MACCACAHCGGSLSDSLRQSVHPSARLFLSTLSVPVPSNLSHPLHPSVRPCVVVLSVRARSFASSSSLLFLALQPSRSVHPSFLVIPWVNSTLPSQAKSPKLSSTACLRNKRHTNQRSRKGSQRGNWKRRRSSGFE